MVLYVPIIIIDTKKGCFKKVFAKWLFHSLYVPLTGAEKLTPSFERHQYITQK